MTWFPTLQQGPNTLSLLHSPSHRCEKLHPSNYCTGQFNLKYELRLEHIQQDSSRVMVCRFLFVTYLQYRDSSYTMSQQTGTQLLNATSLVQSQSYCCRTLVVHLWHKQWGWDKRQGGKRMKQVFRPNELWLQNYPYYVTVRQLVIANKTIPDCQLNVVYQNTTILTRCWL